jgi:hypothetical protein
VLSSPLSPKVSVAKVALVLPVVSVVSELLVDPSEDP